MENGYMAIICLKTKTAKHALHALKDGQDLEADIQRIPERQEILTIVEDDFPLSTNSQTPPFEHPNINLY
jgi:hypothetical protein